ncbi:MAG: GGDEF domain-containing protein [Candidatus Korobacteraceae bacterium]
MSEEQQRGGQREASPEPVREGALTRVIKQLAVIEKRDTELWLIIVITSTVVAAGLLMTLFPVVLNGDKSFQFQISISRELFIGLIALITLVDIYLVTRWRELRRTRQAVISTTLQNEITRLQSFTDPLTETFNRRSLDEMATRYMNTAKRTEKPVTFLIADMDRFKEVNTKFGHLTGDLVINQIASLLKQSVRGCDAVVRYGGDEFLVILLGSSRSASDVVMQRINKYVEDWNRSGHLDNFELTVSMGACEWREGMTLDEVLNTADQDMYAEKARTKLTLVKG